MKKIYESPLHGWDESAERVYMYELDDADEFWELTDMTFDEKCELLRQTRLTKEMTYQERFEMLKLRYGV